MLHTLGTAAKLTGRSRAAIFQAVTSGRIPAAKNDKNQWEIPEHELLAIYPPIPPDKRSPQQPPNVDAHTALQIENAQLRTALESLTKTYDRLHEDWKRDVDGRQRETERYNEMLLRITGMLGQQRQEMLQHFAQRSPTVILAEGPSQPTPIVASAPAAARGSLRGLWQRLVG